MLVGDVNMPQADAQVLSLPEVATVWSRRLDGVIPEATALNILFSAWWRGELVGRDELRRLDLLRSLCETPGPFLRCAVGAEGAPFKPSIILDDPRGRISGFVTRISVPSHKPAEWTIENCNSAFEALAEDWDCADIPELVVQEFSTIKIPVGSFQAFAASKGKKLITPWVEMLPPTLDGGDPGARSLLPKTKMQAAKALVHFEKNMWPEELDPLPEEQWFTDRIKAFSNVNCRETAREVRTLLKAKFGIPSSRGQLSAAEKLEAKDRVAAFRRKV